MFDFPLFIQQIIVGAVTLTLIIFLLREKIKPAYVFFSAVVVFLLFGIIETEDLLNAVSNDSILSIFLLIFITYGIKEHFNLIGLMDKLFSGTRTGKGFMLKMSGSAAFLSSFLNNTPLVALFLPYVYQWSKKHNISPSKLLMPLSFAAMAGGMITVIGTSTNLVLKGLVEAENAVPPGILDYLIPGVLVSLGCVFYLYFVGYGTLPNKEELLKSVSTNPREYLVEVRVVPNSKIIGKSITDAGLRNLSGIYLFEIIRNKMSLSPVTPDEIIEKDDALVFAGDTQNIIELLERKNDFSTPYPNGTSDSIKRLNITETVIPYNSDLIGKTLKEVKFRENYDAAVVAIHRNGERLSGKMGEIKLEAGDLMLITPGEAFSRMNEEHKSLYIISVVKKGSKIKPLAKKGFFLILLSVLIGLFAGKISLFFSLLLLISYMVATGLISIKEIKDEFDVSLFVVLVSSLTFSTALIKSGAAAALAEKSITLFDSFGSFGIIVGIYLITLVLTSFVTHIAAISIVFPIGYAIGTQLPGMDMTALFIAMAFAASASFHSPFSYQTNLMVYGPGGYKFKDFLKTGTPITLIYSILCLSFIGLYYNF